MTVLRCFFCCLLFIGSLTSAQSIPHIKSESLNKTPVSLPEDLGTKPAILIMGFSRAGGNQVGPLARRLHQEQPELVVYQIAELESAPRMVRPMILHGMRGEVPKDEQSRFIPLYRDEKEWKQVTGFTKAGEEDAYVLIVDGDGVVRWSGHGPYSDNLYKNIVAHVQ